MVFNWVLIVRLLGHDGDHVGRVGGGQVVVLDILDWLCRHSQARAVQWYIGQTAYFRCRGWNWKTRERLGIVTVLGVGRTGIEGLERRRSCVVGMWGNWVGKRIRCVWL